MKAENIRREMDGERLREMRMLMGITSTSVCDATKMNTGQYSRIEQGELSAEKVLPYVEELFREWREPQIRRLQSRIEYFSTLCK